MMTKVQMVKQTYDLDSTQTEAISNPRLPLHHRQANETQSQNRSRHNEGILKCPVTRTASS